jgi:hypothetical protein
MSKRALIAIAAESSASGSSAVSFDGLVKQAGEDDVATLTVVASEVLTGLSDMS